MGAPETTDVASSLCNPVIKTAHTVLTLHVTRHALQHPPPQRKSPQWGRASSFSRLHDLLRRKHTLDRTPLDERQARRRDLYPTTHNTHKGQTPMYPGGIRARNPRKRAAAGPRLRPRRHWHQHLPYNWQGISADLTAYLRKNSSCGDFIRENMRLASREIWSFI